MTTKTLPFTSYSVREPHPDRKFRSPASTPIRNGGSNNEKRMLLRAPMSSIPDDATIVSALVRVYTDRAHATSPTINVYTNNTPWNSSATWTTRPTITGTVIATTTHTTPGAGTLYEFDVTTWAATRDKKGLTLRPSADSNVWLAGSSAAQYQPVLVVQYSVVPDPPGNLKPAGGAVSVTKPPLTFDGDDDMTAYRIQIQKNNGTVFDTGFVTASSGFYTQAVGAPTPVAGDEIEWRAAIRTDQGDSDFSEYAVYTYQPLPSVTITNPPSTTDDGTPPLTWTVTGQSQFMAQLWNGSQLVDSTEGWVDDSAARSWTPSKGIKSPGGSGLMKLFVRDAVIRVGGTTYKTNVESSTTFSTISTGSATAPTGVAVVMDGSVPKVTGTRAAGTPDFVALYRDGVQVPIWEADGIPVLKAAGADFFTGTAFTIRDYTADLRSSHTWQVRTWIGTTPSALSTAVTAKFTTPSLWIVNPRTNEQVEIVGYGDVPVVEQNTAENSIVQVPVSGGLIVEPVRRRLVRTTRAGTIQGMVLDGDETELLGWIEGSSQDRYRLIFGKANMSVILGDYSPSDTFYGSDCKIPNRVLVSASWYERLKDY
jgi:hypothetical protein